MDLGGGTTKISLIDRGVVHGMMAVNIGARLVACDASGRLARLERAGDHFLKDLGCTSVIGESLDQAVLEELAAKMAEVLFENNRRSATSDRCSQSGSQMRLGLVVTASSTRAKESARP